MPGAVERLVPRRRRASRRLEDRWQGLGVGDQIPDYGGRNAHLEVVRIEPPQLLLYRDERRGAPFTWAISLTPREGNRTDVQLRFRGRLQSTGLKRSVLRTMGQLLDALSGELMLRGLEERVRNSYGVRRNTCTATTPPENRHRTAKSGLRFSIPVPPSGCAE
jgi:hypothetical protein